MSATRYEDILDERLKQARQAVHEAEAARRPIRWKRAIAAAVVLGCLLVSWAGRDREEPATGGVPFDRAAVVSADTLGLGVHAAELVKARPAPVQTSSPPTPNPSASPRPRPRSVAATPPRLSTAPALLHQVPAVEAGEVALDLDAVGVYVAAVEEALPVLLPPGTRLSVMLTRAIATGAVSAPTSAAVAEDLLVGGRTAVPAGSTLVGEAFATRSDDRVQVVFQALVRDGASVPVRAIAMGSDGQVGLPGTLVRKGSKAKKGLGKVLGAMASTLTFGAVGGRGPADAVADGLLASGASGLTDLERAWTAERSDKVVRVAPGTRLVAWIQMEARLP